MEIWHANWVDILKKLRKVEILELKGRNRRDLTERKVLKWDIITTVRRGLITNNLWNYKKNASLSWILNTVCGKNSLCWITKTDLMEILLPLEILYIQLVVNVTINFGCDLITEICSQWQKNTRKYREFFCIDKRWFLKSLFWICIINIVLALMLVRISWFECLFLTSYHFLIFLIYRKCFIFDKKKIKRVSIPIT